MVPGLTGPPAALAGDFDLALHSGERPYGEAIASAEFGGVALTARHIEYLGYLNRSQYSKGEAEADPLVRSSLLDGQRRFDLGDLGAGASLPIGASVAMDEWQSGHRDLRLTAEGGLNLPGLRLSHSFTFTSSFASDGSETRHSAGRLSFGLDLLGGIQEGLVAYDATPIVQVTMVGIRSEWALAARSATVVALTHRPLERISEARFGLRQPLGPFDLTSDLAADSLGGYAVGVTLALPLGPAAEAPSWSLRDLLSAFSGEHQRPG